MDLKEEQVCENRVQIKNVNAYYNKLKDGIRFTESFDYIGTKNIKSYSDIFQLITTSISIVKSMIIDYFLI